MTHLSERADLGIFVLQDHAARQDGTPVGMRQCLAGVRVIDIPDPDGNTEPVRFGSDRQIGTIGDVHPWMFWQTRDRGTRGMGSWAQAFGGMVVSASPQYGAAAVQPWRRNWLTDTRYAYKNAGVAASLSWYPEGSMLLFVPGTDEDGQYEHAMWADSRLVAPNADGPGECGTLVCDLGPPGALCMDRSPRPGVGGRHARLQTLMRVIAVPEQQSLGGLGAEGNVLALNYGWTGADAIPGFGAVFGLVDGRSSGPITGSGQQSGPNTGEAQGAGRGGRLDGGFESVGGDPFGDPLIGNASNDGFGPSDVGRFRKNPTQGSGIALMASMGPGGPLHLGSASDKHQIGFDADGHPINPGHISTTAFYYHDANFDAPLEFTPMLYPDPPGFPHKTRTHIFFDPKSFHAYGQGFARGLWRLWTEMPDMTPKKPPPITPRPPAPPLPPNDPPPPPNGPPTGGPPNRPPGGPTTPGPGGPGPGGPGTGGPGGPGGGGPGGGPTTPGGGGRGDPRKPDPYPVGGGVISLPPDYPSGKHYPGGDQGGQGGSSGGPQDPGDGPTTGGGGNGGQGLCYDSDYRRRVSRNPASLSNSTFFRGSGYASQAFIGRDNQIGALARSSYTGGSGVAFGTPSSDPREAMGRWSGLDPWTREPEEIPGLRERIGSQEPGQTGTYAMTRPLFWSTSAFAFRPQLWIDKYPNFERNPQLPEQMWENDERLRPQTVVMRAWGMQSAGEGDWDYTEIPMRSRARGGTASGGVVFHPARFEFEDYLGIGNTLDVEDTGAATATDTHVLIAPGVNLSFGTPQVFGDSPVDDDVATIYRETEANDFALTFTVGGQPAMRIYINGSGNPQIDIHNGTSWQQVGTVGVGP